MKELILVDGDMFKKMCENENCRKFLSVERGPRFLFKVKCLVNFSWLLGCGRRLGRAFT